MTTRDLKIDWDWVKKELLRHERIKRDMILNCADESIEEAKRLVSPKIVQRAMKASFIALSTKQISLYLKGATGIIILLVTISGKLEKKASLLMANHEELKGYLFDKIGSLAVESLASCAEDHFRRAYARKGKDVSARFSPGYCDWPLEEQLKISKLIDFSKAGVSLTENCMMVPKKSISAILGVGPKGAFGKTASPCGICGIKDCNYRRR